MVPWAELVSQIEPHYPKGNTGRQPKVDVLLEEIERAKAAIHAKVEHSIRVLTPQFGNVKVRYRGRAKNTAQLKALFAMANLWMVRKRIVPGTPGSVRPQWPERSQSRDEIASILRYGRLFRASLTPRFSNDIPKNRTPQ